MVPIKCCMGIRRSPEIDAAGKRPTPKSAEEQPADSFADRIRKGQYSHVQALVPCTDDSIDDPDTLNEFENDDRDTLLPLQGDTLAERFPEEVQQHIRDLVHTAKRCLQKKDRVEFFRLFRELRENEKRRQPKERVFLLSRLAVWLSGQTFLYNQRSWVIGCCKEADLDCETPQLGVTPRRAVHGQTRVTLVKMQLIDVLASLDV